VEEKAKVANKKGRSETNSDLPNQTNYTTMKLNNTHLNIFKEYCEECAIIFGVSEWKIFYGIRDLSKEGDNAWINIKRRTMTITIQLAEDWDEELIKFSDERFRHYAIHEMIHVLLANAMELACEKIERYNKNEIEELLIAEESLVNRLEKILKPILDKELPMKIIKKL